MQVKKSGVGRVFFTFYDIGVDTSGQNDDNESEGNELQSPTYFRQTETNFKNLLAGGQEDLDVERDNKILNETEDKGNENVTTGKNELSKVNKAVTKRR